MSLPRQSALPTLVEHRPNLLGGEDDCGFGSLLYDARGRQVLDSQQRGWFFTTTRNAGGEWYSQVRRVRTVDWSFDHARGLVTHRAAEAAAGTCFRSVTHDCPPSIRYSRTDDSDKFVATKRSIFDPLEASAFGTFSDTRVAP